MSCLIFVNFLINRVSLIRTLKRLGMVLPPLSCVSSFVLFFSLSLAEMNTNLVSYQEGSLPRCRHLPKCGLIISPVSFLLSFTLCWVLSQPVLLDGHGDRQQGPPLVYLFYTRHSLAQSLCRGCDSCDQALSHIIPTQDSHEEDNNGQTLDWSSLLSTAPHSW